MTNGRYLGHNNEPYHIESTTSQLAHHHLTMKTKDLPDSIIFSLETKTESHIISYLDGTTPLNSLHLEEESNITTKEHAANFRCLEKEIIIENNGTRIKFCKVKHFRSKKIENNQLSIFAIAQCPDNCQKCNSNDTCEQCETNHVFNSIEKSCILLDSIQEQRENNQNVYISNYNLTIDSTNNKSINKPSSLPAVLMGPCPTGQYWHFFKCKPCSDYGPGCYNCAFGSDCTECYPGYYMSGPTCYACDSSCLTCSGSSTSCDSCSGGKFYRDHRCYPCDPSCRSCFETGNTKCTDCQDGYYITGSTCNKCHPNCATCSGSQDNQCLSCSAGKRLDRTNNKCVCPDGKYLDSRSYQCQACHERCTKCQDSKTKCSECRDGYYLFMTSCLQCHENCATCNGKDSNQCLSCDSTKNLIDGSCVCKLSNQYLDEATCKTCDFPCTKCEAAGNTKCSECREGYYLDKGRCREITNTFTPSNEFTPSPSFTNSNTFSKSVSFTESTPFSKSESFSESELFTKSEGFEASLTFSESHKFSSSSDFTNSIDFSTSLSFSASLAFTLSSVFSFSNEFEPTLSFSHSNSFSETQTLILLETTMTDDTISPTLEEGISTSGQVTRSSKMLMIGLIIAAVVVITIIIIIVLFIILRKRREKTVTDDQSIEASAINMATNITAATEDSFASINSMLGDDPFLYQAEENITI